MVMFILQNDADDAISLDDVEADEDIKVEEVMFSQPRDQRNREARVKRRRPK